MSAITAAAISGVERRAQAPAAALVPQYLAPLTSLRFFAALYVAVFHGCLFAVKNLIAVTPGTGLPHLARLVLNNVTFTGYSGVSFFFVLSGFILAYTYLGEDGRLRKSKRAFYIARIARICPIYFVALAFAAAPYYWSVEAAGGFGHPSTLLTIASTLIMLQAWDVHSVGAWDGPAWSLSVEAFFYALFPVLVVPIARLSRRGLLTAMALLWLLSLAVPLLYFAAPRGDALVVVNHLPLGRLPEFLIGAALGRYFVLARDRGRARDARPMRWPSLWAGAAVLGIIAVLAITPAAGQYIYFTFTGLLGPLWAVLIYSMAWGRGRLASFLSLPALVVLGEASYSLYLLHLPLLDWELHFLRFPTGANLVSAAYLAAFLAGAIVLSVLAWRSIEMPLRAAIRVLAFRQAA